MQIGPWQEIGGTYQRRDDLDRTAAVVFGAGEGARRGWYVVNTLGDSRGGHGPTLEEAKRAADQALVEVLALEGAGERTER